VGLGGVTRRAELEALPLREELETLARSYHHLHNELERAGAESSVRREFEDRLEDVRERLDRALEEWVADPELREAWRAHLHNRVAKPDEPAAIRPLVFQGRSEDSGSVVEIRRGDGLEVSVDGSLVERVVADKDFEVDVPPARFRLNGAVFLETFSASLSALEALREFTESQTAPPWDYASELLADGLIDVHFDLTPRGRRALGLG
jgi:hypothetical protein